MAANQEPQPAVRRAAALLLAARSATLATVHDGAPHASLVTPSWDEDGPLLLLSALAAHTRHLTASPACALLFLGDMPGATTGRNPQTIPRLCLTGTAQPVPAAGARAKYLQTHPYAEQYADFADFGFWKINVAATQYIGGFANAEYLDAAALQHEISLLLRDGYG